VARTNRRRVGHAVEVHGVALGRHVNERMSGSHPAGTDWKSLYRRENLDSDVSALTGVILDNWPKVFRDDLGSVGRSLLVEAREWHFRWAHHETFSDRDRTRAVDTIDRNPGAHPAPEAPRGSESALRPFVRVPESRYPRRESMPGTENWRLILDAARALTAAGRTPFSRRQFYGWIWSRYPRDDHDRPSLDPTFQGMVMNATGGPPSAGGKPFFRVERGPFVLAESVSSGPATRVPVGDDPQQTARRPLS
jgi:hypothetical protein